MVSRPFMQQRSDLVWNHYGSLWLPMVAYWLLMVAWGLLGDFLVMYAYHMRKLYIFHKLYSSSSRMIRLYFHSKFDVYPAWETPKNCMYISYISSCFIGWDFRGTPGENPTVEAWACGSDPVPLWGWRSRRKDHENGGEIKVWTKILDK